MLQELPTPPAGIEMVIKAAGDPLVAMHKLGSLIEKEPSLTVMLLRLSNSAAYGSGRSVKTVQQACMLLGTRCIRNIAVSHAVQVAMGGADTGDFDGMRFWEDSLRRATASLVLGRTAGYEDPSEAFTVGLLQDLGMLLMALAWPEHQAELQIATRLPIAERLEREHELCGTTHPAFFVDAAASWGLPEELTIAIGSHHCEATDVTERRSRRLIEIARAADALADVAQTSGAATAVTAAHELLEQLTSRQPLDLEELGEQVNREMIEASRDLQIEIGAQASYRELMAQANMALADINDELERVTRELEQAKTRVEQTNRRLERTLAEKEDLARQLQSKNEALERLAATDTLTQVANRRHFSKALQTELKALVESGRELSLIMVDIDHFKSVNDTYGHATGDEVLKAVCRRIEEVIRPEDLLGRLGGEEFGILLPASSAREGRNIAERVRRGVRGKPIRCVDGQRILVTISLGGCTAMLPDVPTDDQLLQLTDEALYASKHSGRDRVTWTRFAGPER